MFRVAPLFALLATSHFVLIASPVSAAGPSIALTLDPALRSVPFTGRVYVFTGHPGEEPRSGPDWFDPSPFFSKDVEG